jgi:hypothetical protein
VISLQVDHRHIAESADVPIEEVGTTEGVPVTLEEEHGHSNPAQVVDAKLLGPPGRMKGIAVANHP